VSASTSEIGWTFLTGAEYAVSPHWMLRAQYNYYNFGTQQLPLTGQANFFVGIPFNELMTIPVSTELRIQSVTFGLNYQFGSM
jgi:opacity protein-like surface antigen